MLKKGQGSTAAAVVMCRFRCPLHAHRYFLRNEVLIAVQASFVPPGLSMAVREDRTREQLSAPVALAPLLITACGI